MDFTNCRFKEAVFFTKAEFKGDANFSKSESPNVKFSNTIFYKKADFTNSDLQDAYINRAQLIDVNMEYLNIFSVGENEVDVVATFIQTYPKIVLKIGDTRYSV